MQADGWSRQKKWEGSPGGRGSGPGADAQSIRRKALDARRKMAAAAAEERRTQYDRTATPASIAGLGEARIRGFGGGRAAPASGQRNSSRGVSRTEPDPTLGAKLLRIANAGSGKFFSDMAQFGSKAVGGLEEIERYLNSGWTADGTFVKGDSPLVSSLLGGVHDRADALTAQANAELRRSADNWRSPAGRIFQEAAVNGVAAIPQLAAAIGTGGAGAAASLGPQTGAAETALRGLLRRPGFWVTYGQNAGRSYAKAKSAGASENDALVSGTFSGLAGAMIDLGGGYENSGWMNDRTLTGRQLAGKLGRSILEQSGEEYAKGVTARLAEKAYRPDRRWYSARDENAVFTPARDAKQFAKDAATAAFMETAGYAVRRAGDGALRQRLKTDAAPLTEEEFDIYFEQGYNENEDYEEWKQCSALLGDEAPGSFQEFQKIKYEEPESYEALVDFYQYRTDNPESGLVFYTAEKTRAYLIETGEIRATGVIVSPKRNIKIIAPNDHALGRLKERDITIGEAQSMIDTAMFALKQWNGSLYTFYSKNGFASVDLDGVLRTAGRLDAGGNKLFCKVVEIVEQYSK